MSKVKLISILFLLISMFGYGQTKEIDSLKAELLKPSLTDTTRVDLYLDLSDEYGLINIDSVGKYSKLAIKLSELSKEYKFGRTNAQLGRYYFKDGQMDSARYYIRKAIAISKVNADTLLQMHALSFYALTLRDRTDFNEKVQLSREVIELAKKNNQSLGKYQYNLSVLYGDGGYDKLSVKYLKLALKNIDENDNVIYLSSILTNLIHYEMQEVNIDSVMIEKYLSKSADLCKNSNLPKICYYYYLRAGEYYDKTKQYDNAEKAFNNSLKEAKKLNDPYALMFAYISSGQHFVNAKKPKRAIDFFKKFEKLIDQEYIPDLEVWAYEYWAKAEKMVGNFSSSNKYLEKYIKINDSINSENNKASLANADAKYESEKKDKEIAQQNLQLELKETAFQKKKTQYSYMTGATLLLLVGLASLWLIYQQRQKRKNQEILILKREQQVQTLESLMEGEEKERLRISKELHDGVNVDLSAIKYKLTSMLEKNNAVINEVVTMIDKSCEQVRAISHNLVPPSLRDFSLVETIEDFCTTANSIHNPEITFTRIGDAITISKKAEVNIFRIVQELVNNSIKHAEASEINVQLSKHDNLIQLTVEDNGKGFNKDEIVSNGIGLQNIQSRVAYLSAKLDFSSSKNGTSYIIDINTEIVS